MELYNAHDAARSKVDNSSSPQRSTTSPSFTNTNDAKSLSGAVSEVQRSRFQKSCDKKQGPAGERVTQRPRAMTTELYTKTTTPFLRQHVPDTYLPVGDAEQAEKSQNTRYCYRHSPTSTCRRVKDLQKVDMMQKELDKLSAADRLAVSNVWSIYSASPAPVRSLLLHGILESSCFPQLSLLAREVHEQLKIDFITALPTEISIQILRLLDSESLCKAAQVSRQWRNLADDDTVWFHLCQQHVDRRCTKCGWGLPLLEKQRLRARKRRPQSRPTDEQPASDTADEGSHSGQKRELTIVEGSRKRSRRNDDDVVAGKVIPKKCKPWKSVYRERFKIGFNWRHGHCTVKTLDVHQNGVTSLAFAEQNNVIISGSYDTTIAVSDVRTSTKLRTLRGHNLGIRCLKVSGETLFSGSLDATIKIWNHETGECLSTLRGHTDGVLSLDYDDELKVLVSGSMDHTVKVFCFDSKETFSLREHTDIVNSVRIHRESKTIWTASDDTMIRVFDLETKKCIKVFEGHLGQVQQILLMPTDFEPENVTNEDSETSSPTEQVSTPPPSEESARPLPGYFFSVALDNTLKLWSTASGRCIRTTFGHVEGIWSLSGDSLNLATGSQDRTVKIWEPVAGTCQTTYGGHSGPVSAVVSDDTKLVSAGEDGNIIVRSFEGPVLHSRESTTDDSASNN